MIDNEQETNNYTLIKDIGLNVLIIIMYFLFFAKKTRQPFLAFLAMPFKKQTMSQFNNH